MPRPDIDDATDDEEDVDELEEVDESERVLLEEAADEALLEAHSAETSLPWHLFDLFFRPRLSTLRWTQAADDRLRDRAVAVVALASVDQVLAYFSAVPHATDWAERFTVIGSGFVAFLISCIVLAGNAKVYDTIGRGLGAEGNYDRVRVVLAMLAVPPLLIGIPLHLYGIFFADAAAAPADRAIVPVGIGWLLLGAYAVWFCYFPVIALKTVYHFRLGSAIANHIFGFIGASLFWLVVGFVLFSVFRFSFGILHFDALKPG